MVQFIHFVFLISKQRFSKLVFSMMFSNQLFIRLLRRPLQLGW